MTDTDEAIRLSKYSRQGAEGLLLRAEGEPVSAMPVAGGRQCGACDHFPGDGCKCETTLETVSRKVWACGEYK